MSLIIVRTLDSLYEVTSKLLSESYKLISTDAPECESAIMLLEAVGNFIGRCPPPSLLLVLKRLQDGIDLWIADSKQVFSSRVSHPCL